MNFKPAFEKLDPFQFLSFFILTSLALLSLV